MLNCIKYLRFSKPKFRSSICNRARSSLAPTSVLPKCKELPGGLVLEVLNPNTHDFGQVRKLLIDAFVLNEEPIIHTLCERAYSSEPMDKKLPKIERHFEKFFSDEFLSDKIDLGLSLVAIEKSASDRYISSAFVERYCGGIYNTEEHLLHDPFWGYGLRLMSDLNKQARPFLSLYDPGKIAFVSNAATCPEYAESGIMLSIIDLILSRLARRGFEIAYGVLATKRAAKVVETHFGFEPTGAEIMYADYEIDGEKVFAHLAEEHVSAKAMVKFL